MDKAKAQQIRSEVEAALRTIGQNHGLVFKMGGIRYTPTSLRTVISANEGATRDDAAKVDFERRAYQMGAEPDWFGQVVTFRGSRYRVCGLTSRRSRKGMNIIVEGLINDIGTGQRFRLNTFTVSSQISSTQRAIRSMASDDEQMTIGPGDVATISVEDLAGFNNRHED